MTQKGSRPDIGGWLLILVLMMGIYTPLMALKSLYTDFIAPVRMLPALESSVSWVGYRTGTFAIYGTMCALCMAAALLLWKLKRPFSVRFALAVVWLAGPAVPAAQALCASLAFHQDVWQTMKPFYIPCITTAIQSAVCTVYLLRAERVKLTYYR